MKLQQILKLIKLKEMRYLYFFFGLLLCFYYLKDYTALAENLNDDQKDKNMQLLKDAFELWEKELKIQIEGYDVPFIILVTLYFSFLGIAIFYMFAFLKKHGSI